jgi:hypothetical protein
VLQNRFNRTFWKLTNSLIRITFPDFYRNRNNKSNNHYSKVRLFATCPQMTFRGTLASNNFGQSEHLIQQQLGSNYLHCSPKIYQRSMPKKKHILNETIIHQRQRYVNSHTYFYMNNHPPIHQSHICIFTKNHNSH